MYSCWTIAFQNASELLRCWWRWRWTHDNCLFSVLSHAFILNVRISGDCNGFGATAANCYPCHCVNDDVCDAEDGACANGCNPGAVIGDAYQGPYEGYGCQIGMEKDMSELEKMAQIYDHTNFDRQVKVMYIIPKCVMNNIRFDPFYARALLLTSLSLNPSMDK